MQFSYKNIALIMAFLFTLNSCGGSSTSGGGGPGGGNDGPTDSDGISYVPLSVMEVNSEFTFFEDDEVFLVPWTYPFIFPYMISPVNSATLQPITTAEFDDYSVTVNGIALDRQESFPKLEKVIGPDVFLTTALVFDMSTSIDQADMAALVDEAKAYVAAAQAHSNEIIREQRYVVWAFGTNIEELTSGFTRDTTTINNALDAVVDRYNNNTLGGSSSLHRAMVQIIGRCFEDPCDPSFLDSSYNNYVPLNETVPINDLVDIVTPDGIALSQIALFSSGPDTAGDNEDFNSAFMVDAIQSQAFLKYLEPSSAETVRLHKPVFYYVVGDDVTPGETYQNLSEVAESTTSLTLSGGNYSFANDLIGRQIQAIDDRIDLENLYVYRFAFLPRSGDNEVIFFSDSTNFAYTLTAQIEFENPVAVGTPKEEADGDPVNYPLVEISGPNGEYISRNDIKFSEANTFTAATHWTTGIFNSSDYSWSLAGGTGTDNGMSYTVNSIAGASATLTLTNTTRGESVDLIIYNE